MKGSHPDLGTEGISKVHPAGEGRSCVERTLIRESKAHPADEGSEALALNLRNSKGHIGGMVSPQRHVAAHLEDAVFGLGATNADVRASTQRAVRGRHNANLDSGHEGKTLEERGGQGKIWGEGGGEIQEGKFREGKEGKQNRGRKKKEDERR